MGWPQHTSRHLRRHGATAPRRKRPCCNESVSGAPSVTRSRLGNVTASVTETWPRIRHGNPRDARPTPCASSPLPLPPPAVPPPADGVSGRDSELCSPLPRVTCVPPCAVPEAVWAGREAHRDVPRLARSPVTCNPAGCAHSRAVSPARESRLHTHRAGPPRISHAA